MDADAVELDVHMDYIEREQMRVGYGFNPGLGPVHGIPPSPLGTSDVVYDNRYAPREAAGFEPAMEALAASHGAREGVEALAYHDHSHTTWGNEIDKEMLHVWYTGTPGDVASFVAEAKALGYGTPDRSEVHASWKDWLTRPVTTCKAVREAERAIEGAYAPMTVKETEEQVGNRTIYKREITFD